MPTLEFKGKPFVYSHHLSVPFRELVIDRKKSFPGGKKASLDDNLIIHGDNLEALKALLPRYAGKVDVIYIDPPYNTGKEGWAYNDRVNSPLMKEWLGKVVDAEDLERHDKWLCMMWPRVILLHELLSQNGLIFVSIDDNEVSFCRILMNEIFGSSNHLGTLIWKNSTDNNPTRIATEHEYIHCYCKSVEKIKVSLV
jgi:adenine-specific DNA-methyltransferase